MLDALTLVTGVAALLLAAWCGWAAYRDQPTKDWHFIGMAVVTLLALVQMVVGAVSRSVVQISTQFDKAPLAYSLSAVAGVVYGFITYSLVRGGERARK